MNQSAQLNLFYDFSTSLTGYPLIDLYGTGQGPAYFNALQTILGADFVEELLLEYELLVHQSTKETGSDLNQLLENELLNHPKWGVICRNIIKMWFMGNWYQLPQDWRQTYMTSQFDETKVISKQAYIEGLVWKAMSRHPKSAKQPGYETWAFPPNSL